MREIKFRGQRTDNKQWVYGYYFKTPLTDEATDSKPEDGWSFLSGRERHCISQNNCVYEVIFETVGQYIGVKDRNKTEIFEADIVEIDDYIAVIQWDDETSRFIIDLIYENVIYDFDNTYGKELEVVGNIYDDSANILQVN